MQWLKKYFNEREQREIEFCQIYGDAFNHGTDGHNAKVIIYKLIALLHEVEIRTKKGIDCEDMFDE